MSGITIPLLCRLPHRTAGSTGAAFPLSNDVLGPGERVGNRRSRHKSRGKVMNECSPRLLAAARHNDQFLATLSHELRSPLASIHYAVNIMARQTDDPGVQQTRALIERQVSRMTHLIDDLLDASSIGRGRLRLRSERIDLRVVLGNAIETLEPDISERHHCLTAALPRVPVWLQGDASRLEQVFVNLLSNASRYTDAGGTLGISVVIEDREAVIRVRDSGIGIEADALPHIFDLFRQANANDPHSRGGLGIGLAVVRSVIAAHGGRVTVVSAGVGLGSEFTVRLPTE
jgi:signal transduction histidine kinase